MSLTVAAQSLSPSSQTITGQVNAALTATSAISASNFTGTLTYSINPALPAGLSIEHQYRGDLWHADGRTQHDQPHTHGHQRSSVRHGDAEPDGGRPEPDTQAARQSAAKSMPHSRPPARYGQQLPLATLNLTASEKLLKRPCLSPSIHLFSVPNRRVRFRRQEALAVAQ